jgi:hypothetical protein
MSWKLAEKENVSDQRLSFGTNDHFKERAFSTCFQDENYLIKNLGDGGWICGISGLKEVEKSR